MPERLLLADGHALVVESLAHLLSGRFTVLGAANDGEAALALAVRLRPDVLLLELSLPRLDGLAVVRALRCAAPEVRCVFVTGHSDLGHVRAAFAAGAVGYVAKDAAPEELYEAVARAGRGETYVTPGFGLDSAEVPPRQLTEQRSGGLTPRQSEVLRQVALGRTGKQIAAMLGITLKTVESHRSCIARQLGLRSPAGFTRHAVQHGLIALADSSTPMGAAAPPGCPPAGGLRSSGDRRARGPARSG